MIWANDRNNAVNIGICDLVPHIEQQINAMGLKKMFEEQKQPGRHSTYDENVMNTCVFLKNYQHRDQFIAEKNQILKEHTKPIIPMILNDYRRRLSDMVRMMNEKILGKVVV